MSKLKPLFNKVVVEKIEDIEPETKSSIYIPNKPKEGPQKAKVIAVGTGMINSATGEIMELPIKPDDIILYPRHTGENVELDDKKYVIITLENISCIIE